MKPFTLYVRQLSLVLLVVLFSMSGPRQQIKADPKDQSSGKWKQLSQQSQKVPAELYTALEETRYCLVRAEIPTGEAGYLAPNPAQGWCARFGADGLSVETRTASGKERQHWAMSLLSYGYGEKALSVKCAEVVAAGNRIEYRRGSLVEWYVNERRGVEQGFTISEPPAPASERTQSEPLTLRLAVKGDLHAELSADWQSVRFVDATQAAARPPARAAVPPRRMQQK